LEKATESYSRRERNPLDSQKVETALAALLTAETERWQPVIKQAHIALD
jgi:hypothetical protein